MEIFHFGNVCGVVCAGGSGSRGWNFLGKGYQRDFRNGQQRSAVRPTPVAIFGLIIVAILLYAALKAKASVALVAVGLFALYAVAVTTGAYWMSDITKKLLTYGAETKQYEDLAAEYDKINPNLEIQLPRANEASWAILMRARLETRASVRRACQRRLSQGCGGQGMQNATKALESSGAFKDHRKLAQELHDISEATYPVEYGAQNARIPTNKQMASVLRNIIPVQKELGSIDARN